MASVAYVAMRRMKVGDGYREPGDMVPEAAHWPNLRVYLDNKYVREVVIEDPLHPAPQTVPIWPSGGGEGAVPHPAPEPEVEPQKKGERVRIQKPEEETNGREIRVGEVGRVPLGEEGRSVYVPPTDPSEPGGRLSESEPAGAGDGQSEGTRRSRSKGAKQGRGSRGARARGKGSKGAGSGSGRKRG